MAEKDLPVEIARHEGALFALASAFNAMAGHLPPDAAQGVMDYVGRVPDAHCQVDFNDCTNSIIRNLERMLENRR